MIRASAPSYTSGRGSFVTVKLDPPPFLGGVPLSRYTGPPITSNLIFACKTETLGCSFVSKNNHVSQNIKWCMNRSTSN